MITQNAERLLCPVSSLCPCTGAAREFRIVRATMLSRRLMLMAPVTQVIPSATGAVGTMILSLHQYTSAGAGFRKSLEGWARAGIKNVELSPVMLDEFLKTDTIAAAG